MNAPVALAEARPSLVAGGRIAPIIPQSMDEAYRMAKAVCMAGMAPRGMDTPEKAMIAIMRGLEVGLTPFQALDKIAVVNGRPVIWGDGAIGLVRGSGVCEWVKESTAGEGDRMVATCETKRRGEPFSVSRSFSVTDAKKAGLWGKQGPWAQFGPRMLGMRARGFCLRDVYADVLGGLYLREEIEESAQHDATPPRPSPPTAMPPQPQRPAELAPPRPVPPAAAEADLTDYSGMLEAFSNEMGSCESVDALEEADAAAGWLADAPDEIKAEGRKIYAAEKARIERQNAPQPQPPRPEPRP